MHLLVLFFFLMLFMPTVYQGPRAALLFIVIIITFKKKIKVYLHKNVRTMLLLTYFVACYSFVIGIIRDNVGLFPCTPFYLIWPILYMYFIIKCNNTNQIKVLLRTVVYGGLFVASFNLILIVNAFVLNIGILNALGEVLLCKFNIQEGFAEYFSPSAHHLAYVTYFCVSLLIINPQTLNIKTSHLYLCIAVSVIDILLSNRRALWLVIIMLPPIIIAFFSCLPYHKYIIRKVLIITVLAGLLVLGIMCYFLDLDSIIYEFGTSFDFSGEDGSNLERTLQGKSLWNDFLSRPLFGGGIGHVSGYIRTPKGPWAYELTYNYTLAMVGIVGFSIYTIATCWIYRSSICLSKISVDYACLLIPQVMGLTAILIISASNPYIGTFDFVWAIYLPVATINAIYYEQRKSKASVCVS